MDIMDCVDEVKKQVPYNIKIKLVKKNCKYAKAINILSPAGHFEMTLKKPVFINSYITDDITNRSKRTAMESLIVDIVKHQCVKIKDWYFYKGTKQSTTVTREELQALEDTCTAVASILLLYYS